MHTKTLHITNSVRDRVPRHSDDCANLSLQFGKFLRYVMLAAKYVIRIKAMRATPRVDYASAESLCIRVDVR